METQIDDSEEEEEEEEEPQLKYHRLPIDVLKTDMVTCAFAADKFLILGTKNGLIHILDINGNENKQLIPKGNNAHHGRPIRGISLDLYGNFFATCADESKVVVYDIYKNAYTEHKFNRPITCVAIDPLYSKNKLERFVCGGTAGRLIMSEKGWFSSNLKTIHEGEGPIHAISWEGDLIAWANDIGVKIYDMTISDRITYIDRPRGSPRPELYKCCLEWENSHTLIIGWADCIKVGAIKLKQNSDGTLSKYVEIVVLFQTDYFICGIVPFEHDKLLILAYPDMNDKENEKTGPRPSFSIISRGTNYSLCESTALAINGFEKYKARDYSLATYVHGPLYYLISPQDLIVAKPRDLDDHLAWLLERKRYEEALNAVTGRESELRSFDKLEIGEKYVGFLLSNTDTVQKAAELCPKILGTNESLWEKWIYKFSKIQQLSKIAKYIPVSNPTLSSIIYEMVLNHYLNYDIKGFLQMITDWPSNIYSLHSIIFAVEEKYRTKVITPEMADDLMTALAKLYSYDQQYEKTLAIYLQRKNANAFNLIQTYNLFDKIGDKVLDLMKLNSEKAVTLLVNNINKIHVERVLDQLKSEPRLQLDYLDHLFFKNMDGNQNNQEARDFHNLQVALYAEYNSKNLYQFLEKSGSWDLDKALSVCKAFGHWREVVYILGRLGEISDAINLMIEKVGDVKQAIDFVQKQNDPQLWDELISKSIKNPVFVSGLLDNLGTHINPLKLIQQIPKGMPIAGLRDRLVKIISDYLLQTSLSQGCKDVMKADVITLNQRHYATSRKPVLIDQKTIELYTNTPVLASCQTRKRNVTVFMCQHIYYEDDLLKLMAQQEISRQQSRTTAPVQQQQQQQQLESLQEQFRLHTNYVCPQCKLASEGAKVDRRKPRK